MEEKRKLQQNERAKRYREKHRDEINAKKREDYNKKINGIQLKPKTHPICDECEYLYKHLPDELSESTKKLIYNAAKRLYQLFREKSLLNCSDTEIKNTIEQSNYSDATKLTFMRALFHLIRLIPNNKKNVDSKTLNKYYNTLEFRHQSDVERRKKMDGVPHIDEYQKLIKEKFGENSKEFLITDLYKEAPLRDEFSGLRVVDKIPEKIDNNIIVVNDDAKSRLIITDYKTAKKYGIIDTELSPSLTNRIKNYLLTHKLKNNILFAKNLGSFINNMNKELNDPRVKGSINFLRHVMASSLYQDKTEEEIVNKYLPLFGHSIKMFHDYIRPIV